MSGKSADPAAPLKEFYRPPPPLDLGDPATDPPMTVRVESWEGRFDPGTRRVIRSASANLWIVVVGDFFECVVVTDDMVRDWPIAPPITYATAFRHAESRRAKPAELSGDMGVEAFKGDT